MPPAPLRPTTDSPWRTGDNRGRTGVLAGSSPVLDPEQDLLRLSGRASVCFSCLACGFSEPYSTQVHCRLPGRGAREAKASSDGCGQGTRRRVARGGVNRTHFGLFYRRGQRQWERCMKDISDEQHPSRSRTSEVMAAHLVSREATHAVDRRGTRLHRWSYGLGTNQSATRRLELAMVYPANAVRRSCKAHSRGGSSNQHGHRRQLLCASAIRVRTFCRATNPIGIRRVRRSS